MVTILMVIVFSLTNLAVVISNKSNFKILFSTLTSLIIFIFFKNLNYEFADLYLTFVTLMSFVSLSYVKFSQTGKNRVLPSIRNNITNNLVPIISVLFSSVLVIILLSNVSDETIEKEIFFQSESVSNYLSDFNLMFVAGISTTILFICLMKRVRE